MKKIIIFISILFSSVILTSCDFVLGINYEIPDYESYKLSNIDFEPYIQTTQSWNDTSLSDVNEKISTANIKIKNRMYYSSTIFSPYTEVHGSGVIFYETDNYYYALTNQHVVENYENVSNQRILVEDYHERIYYGFVYPNSEDEMLDIAIIVFEKKEEKLTVLNLVDGFVEINEHVIVLSNPGDRKNILTNGYVVEYSKVYVYDMNDKIEYKDFDAIIHTALIESGSSGSMLINLDLNIVGINFAGSDDLENPMSFATPSKLIINHFKNNVFI